VEGKTPRLGHPAEIVTLPPGGRRGTNTVLARLSLAGPPLHEEERLRAARRPMRMQTELDAILEPDRQVEVGPDGRRRPRRRPLVDQRRRRIPREETAPEREARRIDGEISRYQPQRRGPAEERDQWNAGWNLSVRRTDGGAAHLAHLSLCERGCWDDRATYHPGRGRIPGPSRRRDRLCPVLISRGPLERDGASHRVVNGRKLTPWGRSKSDPPHPTRSAVGLTILPRSRSFRR